MPANFPRDFAQKLAVYITAQRNNGSEESDVDLKSRFAVTYVPHLLSKPLIRVTFTGAASVTSDSGFTFGIASNSGIHTKRFYCGLIVNGEKCNAGLSIPKEATQLAVLGILTGIHRHQRYSTDSYENGMLIEVNVLIDCCEELKAAEASNEDLLSLFENGVIDYKFLPTFADQIEYIKNAHELYVEHVKNKMKKRGSCLVYNKFRHTVTKESSLRDRAEGMIYIGQTGDQKRESTNNRHDIGLRLIQKCGSNNVPTINAYSRISKVWAEWIETMTLGCFFGCHRDQGYQLANKSLGGNYDFVVGEATDKMLASFLFVYGLLKSENWRIETLTAVDYKALYEDSLVEIEQKDAKIAELRAQIQDMAIEPKRKTPRN
ncbi:hypothetical protein M3Y97_00259300 [Aphelenchoides bicaudatus]|nr:hypothetical protein M3Y97_00259300 [Aphelenchoides bicaudatus]